MDNQQRLKELERSRRRGGRSLAAGVAQAEVARRVGVTRTTVSRWEQERQAGGLDALHRAERFGRPQTAGRLGSPAGSSSQALAPVRRGPTRRLPGAGAVLRSRTTQE